MINEKITAIVPKDLMDQIAAEYKSRRLKAPNRKPQLFQLFKSHGVGRKHFDQILGLVGSTEQLHYWLAKEVELETDAMSQLFKLTIKEAQSRLPNMSNREFVEFLKVLGDLTCDPKPQQQTNINFDMNEYLAGRLNEPSGNS